MGLTPSFRIEANSADITAIIRSRFSSLTITDSAGLASDTLTITLTDHDDESRIQLPSTGAELAVWLGYEDGLQRMGLFVVDSIEISGPPDRITIQAKAAPQDQTPAGKTAMQSRKFRSWESGLTLAEVAQTIAEEHNLTPAISAELGSKVLPHYDQVGESDMNLLTRIAQTYGAIAKPADGRLVIAPRGESKTVSAQPLPGVSLTRQEITSWSVSISKRSQFKSVQARWFDKSAGAEKIITAGVGEPVMSLRHPLHSEAQAKDAADSEYRKGQRGSSTLNASLPGRTDIIAETPVSISGVRFGVDGQWVVERATHSLDGGGYRTSISASIPA